LTSKYKDQTWPNLIQPNLICVGYHLSPRGTYHPWGLSGGVSCIRHLQSFGRHLIGNFDVDIGT
jgi:hypothetical protein